MWLPKAASALYSPECLEEGVNSDVRQYLDAHMCSGYGVPRRETEDRTAQA
jgi:hypothetical protein